MSKSKLTLLIDGNWLFMSRLSVLMNKCIDDLELIQEVKILMIKSIKIVLHKFPNIDNIIFCADGGSWRNNIELPQYLQNYQSENDMPVTYKGTRIKSEDVNWELFFSEYENFLYILKQSGINVCKEEGIEGDDWCWWWSTYLNSQNTNCIIWTKDNDLKQLVNIDSNKCFTTWWNIDSGLFIKDYEETEFDFLLNSSFNENEQIWNDVMKYGKTITKIDPKIIIIDKILKGDASDNIFPIILRDSRSKDSTKKFKISTKDIDYSLDYKDDNKVREYIHHLVNLKNYVGRISENKSENDIIEHFNFNKKLIVLQKDNYPPNILETLNHYKEYNLIKNISEAESQIFAASNKITGILNII